MILWDLNLVSQIPFSVEGTGQENQTHWDNVPSCPISSSQSGYHMHYERMKKLAKVFVWYCLIAMHMA